MHTARFQLHEPEAVSLYLPPATSTQTANGRDSRFPPGWWIIPAVLPGLTLLIWGIVKLF